MHLGDRRSHAIVHCVPAEDSAFHRAPLVFKKAMSEAESEWSQHHAKAVIDTKAKVTALCLSVLHTCYGIKIHNDLLSKHWNAADDLI